MYTNFNVLCQIWKIGTNLQFLKIYKRVNLKFLKKIWEPTCKIIRKKFQISTFRCDLIFFIFNKRVKYVFRSLNIETFILSPQNIFFELWSCKFSIFTFSLFFTKIHVTCFKCLFLWHIIINILKYHYISNLTI
jgi:hypothetical protein